MNSLLGSGNSGSHGDGENGVLFVTPVAPWGLFGGTATVSQNLISLLTETLRAQICCIASHEAGTYPRTAHGATILSRKVSGLARRLRFFFDFSSASFASRQFDRKTVRARFAALLAERRPKVVIFDHIFSTWLMDLVRDPSARLIYIAHDDMVAYADSLLRLQPPLLKRLRFLNLRRQYERLQRQVLLRCQLTLALTKEDASLLAKANPNPVEVAPLFFDFPEQPRNYPRDFHSLLATGSFDTWEKQLGFRQFLENIFVPLTRLHPDLRLVVAGRIPADFQLTLLCAEPSIRIVSAPTKSEMGNLLQEASAAVVLDLQASGLKIKTMELAATGLPLVSWEPGLEGTMLVHEQSCLCAKSAEQFATQLSRLFLDPDLRRQLGTNARQTVRSQFSRDTARSRLGVSRLAATFATVDK